MYGGLEEFRAMTSGQTDVHQFYIQRQRDCARGVKKRALVLDLYIHYGYTVIQKIAINKFV